MARTTWHRQREEDAVTISRSLPARFDLGVETRVPCARPVSLTSVAQQVRQDLWRRLQGVRGFLPVVRVEAGAEELVVRAGGEIRGGRATRAAEETISAMLENPALRARWIAHAGRRSGQ